MEYNNSNSATARLALYLATAIIIILAIIVAVQNHALNNPPLPSALMCPDVECLVEARAKEIFAENHDLYYEMARTDAMSEMGRHIVQMMYVVEPQE